MQCAARARSRTNDTLPVHLHALRVRVRALRVPFGVAALFTLYLAPLLTPRVVTGRGEIPKMVMVTFGKTAKSLQLRERRSRNVNSILAVPERILQKSTQSARVRHAHWRAVLKSLLIPPDPRCVALWPPYFFLAPTPARTRVYTHKVRGPRWPSCLATWPSYFDCRLSQRPPPIHPGVAAWRAGCRLPRIPPVDSFSERPLVAESRVCACACARR